MLEGVLITLAVKLLELDNANFVVKWQHQTKVNIFLLHTLHYFYESTVKQLLKLVFLLA